MPNDSRTGMAGFFNICRLISAGVRMGSRSGLIFLFVIAKLEREGLIPGRWPGYVEGPVHDCLSDLNSKFNSRPGAGLR